MTTPCLSRLATDLLAGELPAHEEPSREDEARAILAVEAAIRSSGRRRRVRRAAVAGALVVAASAALLFGWRMGRPSLPPEASRAAPVRGTPALVSAYASALSAAGVVLRGARELELSDRATLESGDRVVTAQEDRVAVTLSTGTHLVVDGASDFTIAELGSTMAFALAAGSVHADVAILRAGERFLVRTPDGEVEVRGTSFEVAVVAPSPACGGGARTRVSVSEGVVVVRSAGLEESVRRGESWPRGCGATVAAPLGSAAVASPGASGQRGPAVAATAELIVRPQSPPAAPTPVSAHSASGAAASASELAAQNAIFAEASAARRRGDAGSAIAAYDRLVARYPSSPLAENAYVERMRLLAGSDGRRAAEVARAYLGRYPHGFARSEAQDLVAKER